MHENDYNLSKQAKITDMVETKKNFLHGEFKKSNQFDNSLGNDWTIRDTKQMIKTKKGQSDFKRNTLRSTADQFMTNGVRYNSQMQNIDDLPRLSILENYKSIKKIMNQNYIKGRDQEKKFRNRTKKDNEADEEYQKWRDEQTNSQKMSTILRSLNTTKGKKPTTMQKKMS